MLEIEAYITALEAELTAVLNTEVTVSAQLDGIAGVPRDASAAPVAVFPVATQRSDYRKLVADTFLVTFSYGLPAANPKAGRADWLRIERVLIAAVQGFRFGAWGELDWQATNRQYAAPYAVSVMTFTSSRGS